MVVVASVVGSSWLKIFFCKDTLLKMDDSLRRCSHIRQFLNLYLRHLDKSRLFSDEKKRDFFLVLSSGQFLNLYIRLLFSLRWTKVAHSQIDSKRDFVYGVE
jgi:hypothetical protein